MKFSSLAPNEAKEEFIALWIEEIEESLLFLTFLLIVPLAELNFFHSFNHFKKNLWVHKKIESLQWS